MQEWWCWRFGWIYQRRKCSEWKGERFLLNEESGKNHMRRLLGATERTNLSVKLWEGKKESVLVLLSHLKLQKLEPPHVVSAEWRWKRHSICTVRYFERDYIHITFIAVSVQFSSIAQSCPTLRPRESQLARPPCPSPTPAVYPNLCPSTRWCHPAISSSVVPFSSCPQSLPAWGSFPMSQLFK